jgi:2'-5' RNA ligase
LAYAIELFFDAATDAAVRAVWRELGHKGVPVPAIGSDARPHVTLAVYGRLDAALAAERLGVYAARVDPFRMTLAFLGLFPPSEHEAVVFAGPTVTADLLAAHARVGTLLDGVASSPHPYYLPGRWVPHCTLTQHCPPDRVGEVIEICRALPLPLDGRIEAIGVIETRPIRLLSLHRLRGVSSDGAGR